MHYSPLPLVSLKDKSSSQLKFKSLTYSKDPTSLTDEDVRAFYQSDENTLWVATGNGLNKVDIKSLKVVLKIGEKQGLSESTLYSLLPDESGNLWISTLDGLNRFDPNTLQITNYHAYHGLQDNEFNFNARHKDNQGNLYFGGINGVSHFNPSELSSPDNTNDPVILNIDAFDTNLNKKNIKGIIKASINADDIIPIDANYRRLNIHFSNFDYVSPQLVNYRYRLKGLEKDWNETTFNEQNLLNYYNLRLLRSRFNNCSSLLVCPSTEVFSSARLIK